ncbi:MAG: hypothetical protein Q7U16_14745 [Agitococcus sp.]|nr:hypothetical protein [Agitococcus sp.]
MNKNEMIALAQGRVSLAEREIASFAAKLLVDPEGTIRADTGIFYSTANLLVWQYILGLVNCDYPCSLKGVVDALEEYVAKGAARPMHSSSLVLNHLEQEKLRAQAEAYLLLKGRLKYMPQKAVDVQVITA